MGAGDSHCHTASIEVDVEARTAFDYLADGLAQGAWTLGAWDRRPAGDDVVLGTSLFDETEAYVRLVPQVEHLLVSCHVGPAPDRLIPRIWIRVVPGEELERAAGTCVVTIAAWRPAGQSDESWRRTRASHEAEVFLIKGLLERRGQG